MSHIGKCTFTCILSDVLFDVLTIVPLVSTNCTKGYGIVGWYKTCQVCPNEWVSDRPCVCNCTNSEINGWLGMYHQPPYQPTEVVPKMRFCYATVPAKAGGGITDSEINWCFERRETQSIACRRQRREAWGLAWTAQRPNTGIWMKLR